MVQSTDVSTRHSRTFASYLVAGASAIICAVVAAILLGGLSGELPVDDPTASEVARWTAGNAALWACFAALTVSIVCAWLSSRALASGRTRRTLVLAGIAVVATIAFGVMTWFVALPPVLR